MNKLPRAKDPEVAVLEHALADIGAISKKLDDASPVLDRIAGSYDEYVQRTQAVRNVYLVARSMAKSSAIYWHDMECAISTRYLSSLARSSISNVMPAASDFALQKLIFLEASTKSVMDVPPCVKVEMDHVAFFCRAQIGAAGTSWDITFTFAIYVACDTGLPVVKMGRGIQISGVPSSATEQLEETQRKLTKQVSAALHSSCTSLVTQMANLAPLGISSQPTFLTSASTDSSLNLLATFQSVSVVNPSLNSNDLAIPLYYKKQLGGSGANGVHPPRGLAYSQPVLPIVKEVPWGNDVTLKIRSSFLLSSIRATVLSIVSPMDNFQDLSQGSISGVADPFDFIGGSISFIAHFSYSVMFFDYDYYSEIRIDLGAGSGLVCNITHEVYDGYGWYDWQPQVHTHWVTDQRTIPIGSARLVTPSLTTDALYLHLKL